MTVHKYGWQDSLGGVEPGFAEARPPNAPVASAADDDRDDRPAARAAAGGDGAARMQDTPYARLD